LDFAVFLYIRAIAGIVQSGERAPKKGSYRRPGNGKKERPGSLEPGLSFLR